MKEDEVSRYFEKHAVKLEKKYLKHDPDYQKRELELMEAIAELEPSLKCLGEDAWMKFDRVLTAHNQCEAYAQMVMYVRGVKDAIKVFKHIRKGQEGGRD